MPLVYAHEFVSGSPDDMVYLRAIIFGSVMHLYWGHTHTRNYAVVDNILEMIKF